ncbi:MAG: serine/threonine protein kinase [Myxococcales bacterium]|nr:serine/threonine protein kinase [Myxococcales bacterium]
MQDTAIQRARTTDVIEGYRLVQLVGRGGMGEVHQAVQLSLGRTVAVKLLKQELAKDEQFVGRFEKEAAALATLRHPNIVSIVDRGKSANTYYLVMEFVDGQSLRERMRNPDFDAPRALVTLLQVTRAIDYAHQRGVIHRDLKPENILFDEQAGDIPKVTDFGLAGFDEKAGQVERNLTQTHVSMGTASYMAPEQAVDAKSAGPRADVYSLGVMLYECLTGELPVGTFDPPSVRKSGLDKRLDGIVSRCLKPAPEDRYASAGALLADLEKLVQFTTSLPALSKETKAQRLLRKSLEVGKRVWRGVSLAVVLVAAIIIAMVFVRAKASGQAVAAGVELMTDFGQKAPLSTPGRLDKDTRQVTLGDGPDVVSVMALGRTPELARGAIVYGEPEGATVGRAVVDAELIGDGLEVSALVDTEPIQPSALEPLWALFRGPRPDARSALMLLGDHGRYVALVVSGSGDEPTLEWSLGPDKRGVITAPLPTKTEGLRLALRIDPETGELFGVVGAERDARVLGTGVWLGPNWRQLLSETPRFAVGCLDGTCAFKQLRLQGIALPSGLSPPAFPPEDVLSAPDDTADAPGGGPGSKRVVTKPPVKPPPTVAKTTPPPAKPPPARPPVKPSPPPKKPAPPPPRRK